MAEKKYLEKEVLINIMINGLFPDKKIETPFDVLRAIEEAPTADVVEVVRCKDCVHQPNLKTNTKGMMWCRKFRSEVTAIDFCSYGERTPQKEE